MALRIFVHDSKSDDDSGEPLGMVEADPIGEFYYDNLRDDPGSHIGGYPTIEECLNDLIDELGL